MLELISKMDNTINRPYFRENKDTEKHKKDTNKKQYQKVILEEAEKIINRCCDLIEEGQGEMGHVCANTDNIESVVEDLVLDLEEHKKKGMIVLSHLYKYEPADMYLPDDVFLNKHENILNDCIDDIRCKVIEISEEIFWDNYEPRI